MRGTITAPGEVRVEFDSKEEAARPTIMQSLIARAIRTFGTDDLELALTDDLRYVIRPKLKYAQPLDNVLAAIRANTLANEAEQAQDNEPRRITGEEQDD